MKHNLSIKEIALVGMCAPLLMTTFSKEFFFRVFLQLRFENAFGAIPAIILSGLVFSI